jgi:hypothetical protein
MCTGCGDIVRNCNYGVVAVRREMKRVFEGYCPKGFENNFKWQTKKNPWGKLTTFFWVYLSKETPLREQSDTSGFIKLRVTIEQIKGEPKC